MTVLVCGDKNWDDYQVIRDRLALLPPGTGIRHGDCRGADRMAAIAGHALGFEVEAFPADWESGGPSAGPRRNRLMATVNPIPELCIAFHHDITKSTGTLDMVRVARQAGIATEIIS